MLGKLDGVFLRHNCPPTTIGVNTGEGGPKQD